MESNLRQQNITLSGYLYFCVLLFAYVFWRSLNVSFTHDESLSYTIITGNETQLYTANNHWLNTILMFLFSKLFGYSEWALRLPNLLALVVYMLFIYKIYQHFCKSVFPLIIAVPLLLLNPFIIDFFGLARGYGLGIAFFTASVYYFMMYFQRKQSLKYLSLLVICNLCCIYSNYAFLTAVLGLHGASLIYFSIYKKHLVKISLFYVAEIILLVPAVLNILLLSENNELYVGGDNNVYQDTFKSILDFSFGNDFYDPMQIILILVFISFLSGLFFLKSRSLNFIQMLILFLLLIPTAMHYTLGMRYPKDRAALYWMISIGFFILFAADQILQPEKIKKLFWFPLVVFSSLGILGIANFITLCNLRQTIIWKYDADVENAIQLLEKQTDKNKTYQLGIHWLLEPSINYYRETQKLNWILPVTRDGVASKYDYYLVFEEDLSVLKDRKMKKIHYYPKSEMYVMEEILK